MTKQELYDAVEIAGLELKLAELKRDLARIQPKEDRPAINIPSVWAKKKVEKLSPDNWYGKPACSICSKPMLIAGPWTCPECGARYGVPTWITTSVLYNGESK